MKLIHKIVLIVCTLACSQNYGQEVVKAMFYNVLNFPLQGPVDRVDHLEVIIDDYQPDIFMVCELNNEQGSNDILTAIQNTNTNYVGATYVENTSDDDNGNQNDLQNMLYYDSTKFILESQSEIITDVRDFNYYVLKLNTTNQDTNPVRLNVFITHLKSSSGSTNEAIRFGMVQDFVAFLETLASDSYVLLGGDLNFYTSSEDGFLELLDGTNNITFEDPADRIGSWHNNTSYLDVFTQSTRTQTGLGGATGGFDDRFDFILTSENMLSNSELFYVPDSYQVYGNNNNINCYNQEINTNDCSGSDYDQTVRDALYLMSDHLPVTVSLETSEEFLNINTVSATMAIAINGSNLVTDWLSLSIDPNMFKAEMLSIVNTMGQTIDQIQTHNLNHLEINVSNLSSGLYYLIASNNVYKPVKFIKK